MYGFKIRRPGADHIRLPVIWRIATRRGAERTSPPGEGEGGLRQTTTPGLTIPDRIKLMARRVRLPEMAGRS